MTYIIKIAFLGLVGVFLALPFKKEHTGFSLGIGVCLGMLILGFALNQVKGFVSYLNELLSELGAGKEYLGILLKVTGMTYICEFCSGVCKDAGFQTLSEQLDILGKMSVILSGLPIFYVLLEQIEKIV